MRSHQRRKQTPTSKHRLRTLRKLGSLAHSPASVAISMLMTGVLSAQEIPNRYTTPNYTAPITQRRSSTTRNLALAVSQSRTRNKFMGHSSLQIHKPIRQLLQLDTRFRKQLRLTHTLLIRKATLSAARTSGSAIRSAAFRPAATYQSRCSRIQRTRDRARRSARKSACS